MNITRTCVSAVMAAALCGAPALAADVGKAGSGQQAADKDFTKLSIDGIKAFRDVDMARMAIFNGETAKAKTYVEDAQAAFAKAKAEDTVFMKAEADMKPAPGDKQATPAATPSKTAVAWIPVDGQMSVGEDYVDTPDKTAGMSKPGAESGDKKGTDTVRLSDLDVSFTAEVVPLETSIASVDTAAQMIGKGHYYEANLALKSVEDGARFDTEIISAVPAKSHS